MLGVAARARRLDARARPSGAPRRCGAPARPSPRRGATAPTARPPASRPRRPGRRPRPRAARRRRCRPCDGPGRGAAAPRLRAPVLAVLVVLEVVERDLRDADRLLRAEGVERLLRELQAVLDGLLGDVRLREVVDELGVDALEPPGVALLEELRVLAVERAALAARERGVEDVAHDAAREREPVAARLALLLEHSLADEPVDVVVEVPRVLGERSRGPSSRRSSRGPRRPRGRRAAPRAAARCASRRPAGSSPAARRPRSPPPPRSSRRPCRPSRCRPSRRASGRAPS